MTRPRRPAIKIHGGKFYLSKWVIEHFPRDYQERTYVEPFFGGGSVFLNKSPSIIETINDLDPSVVAINLAIRDRVFEFMARLKEVPYSEETFLKAKNANIPIDVTSIDYAVNRFIVRRMSRGGLQKAFAWSERKRGGRPGDQNAFMTIVNSLPDISERLQCANIWNKDAVSVINELNCEGGFVYCDPTYLKETRTAKNAYQFEMTEQQHFELAQALNAYSGKVMISGYPSEKYAEWFKGWNVKMIDIANHSSQSKTKQRRTEVIWMNY